MTMRTPALLLLGACGGAGTPAPAHPLGVDEHLAEADRHEADARALDETAAKVEGRPLPAPCGDPVLSDQVSSGGERLIVMQPCWTGEHTIAARHRETAQDLRDDATRHRRRARALLSAERRSCASMPPDELDHSPFAHREDVVSVTAIVAADEVRGARLRIRKVA